jgi:DNA invertase Pin-like site-specific DNA recombinase
MPNKAIKRCAVYARKSSDEGLEQDYNSLDAQREACQAFIKSQAGEGWRLLKTAYDDGGFSGGTMERPALQRLLTNIREGLVDVVVVYKVDRLTRSLADFAKMVELFDARGASFVAVTQQFNTTTSMGRLTLNVLLSFAQFEREVIGERIRDKIAASKRKGIWMGGTVPLGYDVQQRKLVINPDEASIVRHIFECYLELGSVRLLKQELNRRGITSKIKTSRNGGRAGGKPFSRGALYHLLSNPIYVGEIPHKNERHPGQHEALVTRELWAQAQHRLKIGAARKGEGSKTVASPSPLAGKLFNEDGEPLYVQGAAKGQRRYRYYVSRSLVIGESQDAQRGWRLPANEIEQAVARGARGMLSDQTALTLALDGSGNESASLASVLRSAAFQIERLQSETECFAALAEITERAELVQEGIRLSIKLPLAPKDEKGDPSPGQLVLTKLVPIRLKKRGIEMRMVVEGDVGRKRIDRPLLKAVARARRWSLDLIAGRISSLGDLARREKVDGRSMRRLIQLGFLSPRIVEAMVEGRQPSEMSVIALTRRIKLAARWSEQEQVLGIH